MNAAAALALVCSVRGGSARSTHDNRTGPREGVDYIDDRLTRTLLAMIEIHDRDGRVTIGGLARHLGIAKSTLHTRLNRLRGAGLVEWGAVRHGTLRPSVGLVKFGRAQGG